MRRLSHKVRERGPLPEDVVAERQRRLPRAAPLERRRGHRSGCLLLLRLLLYLCLLLLRRRVIRYAGTLLLGLLDD